jgi:hypothetical protein
MTNDGHLRRLIRLLSALLALALFASGAPAASPAAPAGDGWVPFEGTWSAAGQRRVLQVGERETATTFLSGSLVVVKGEGLRKGFRAEAIGFDDGAGSGVGALVLTDDRGDRVFCELKGSSSETGKLLVATITGGSGSYSGITGDFSFQWQTLIRAGDGEIQGLAVDLKGRYRRGGPARASPEVTR